MALGEFKMFQWKSKEQREKEAREYATWAFPHGEKQKENLGALILELKPKASLPLSMASFLTCKELYERTLESSESRESAVEKMLNAIGNYNQLIKSDEMPMYLALVLADADLDEECEYPAIEEIRVRIQELNDLKIAKKFSLFKKRSKS